MALLAGGVAVGSLHRRSRLNIEFTIQEGCLRVSGAGFEDFFRLAERVYFEGGSPERVNRLCRRANDPTPEVDWRSILLMLKARFQPIIAQDLDSKLAAADQLAREGRFESAERMYLEVLEKSKSLETRADSERAELARSALALPHFHFSNRN